MALYTIEPFGQDRIDLGAAVVATTIAEVNRDPKSRSAPFTYKDFLPKYRWRDEEKVEAAVSGEDLTARAMDVFRRLGGTVAKKVKGK